MIEEIKKYYEDLAPTYDSNRFENSYGKYIDKQERLFLKYSLPSRSNHTILDIGCGTGRFLDFANHAIDISPKMIEIAKLKFPETNIKEGSVSNIPFEDDYFDTIFSFHVIMHLNPEITLLFLEEAHKKLKNKGTLLFDFPSKKRRKLIKYNAENWHGANSFSIVEIQKMIANKWIIKKSKGILFLPIHRFPKAIRFIFIKLDNFISKSFLKEYASYIIIELEKK